MNFKQSGASVRKSEARILLTVLLLFTAYCLLVTNAESLEVKRGVLPNGLTILHTERHNLPTVMVTVLVKASPLDESPEKAGLANLTAELLTEGTSRRKAADISEEIEFIGASLKTFVDNDYTLISLSVLKKDVEKGFELLSDILLNPIFPEEEILRNKELIKGAIRQNEESPSYVAAREFNKAVFGGLPYGRLITGSLETLDNIRKEDIERFHMAYYRPGNSFMSVVGDLSAEELKSLVQKFLASWKSLKTAERRPVHQVDKKKKTLIVDKELTQANIMLGHAGMRREEPDYYAASVMNYILGGGGFSSRLMEIIRDEKGLAYDVHSYFAPYKDGGLFEIGVQTKNESAGTVVSEILKQMKRIRQEPVSQKELEDAKAYLTGSFPRKLETNRKIADFLTAVEFYGLGFDYIEKYAEYINSVNREDVLRVAHKYLDPENYILVIVADKSKAKIGKEDIK